MIRFSDIRGLPKNENGTIKIERIKELLPSTPDEIIIELYSNHGMYTGSKPEYSELRLDLLQWSRTYTKASEIIKCDCIEDMCLRKLEMTEWFRNAENPWVHYGSKTLNQEHKHQWLVNGTWKKAPIFLERMAIDRTKGLWLMEGATRAGILTGLVERLCIELDSMHEIWIGEEV